MRNLVRPIAAAIALACAAAPAAATQFTYVFDSHFTTNSGYLWGTGEAVSGSGRLVGGGTDPGLGVTATAWNATTASNGVTTIAAAQLGMWAGGLGVVSAYDNYNGCGTGNCGMHQIDNVGNTAGSTSYDFVQLTFSQAVTLAGVSRYAFGQVLGSTTIYDDDASYGRGATIADVKLNHTDTFAALTAPTTMSNTNFKRMLSGAILSGDTTTPSLASGQCNANQTLYGSTVCYDSRSWTTTSSAYTASNTWWISAALLNPDNKSDAFKLYDFKVVYNDTPGQVPEPASWAMMIAGFGAVGTALRRRKAAGRLSAA